MEIHQEQPRGRSRGPREPIYGDPTKTRTKRLFSNRSRTSDRESDHGENETEDEDQHSGKRYRTAEWPLPSNTPVPSPRAPLRSRNAPNSPQSQRRPSGSAVRPSRFMEGSMNDRISSKPPPTYIGNEESRDRYGREVYGRTMMARPHVFTHQSTTSIDGSTANQSDVSRQSGIFRFGKSIAASFNPSNWRIFNKPQEDPEETAQQKVLRERREKAEDMYQELKKSGHFRDSTFHPSLFQQREEEKAACSTKHDSGVVLEDQRPRSRSRSRMSRRSTSTSREDKRKGKVFLEPPNMPNGGDGHFSHSPASTHDSTYKQKAKFRIKKPSLSNIPRSGSVNRTPAPGIGDHIVRHVPSRKDLQKQQKLVKRVSDLEGKLEAARRQLQDVVGEPVPTGPPRIGRSRFVPGAMPSLPSERLLSGYVASEMSESISVSQIGKAITRDESVISDDRLEEELEIEQPTRVAPPPPNFDKALPLEPEIEIHDRPMHSVEDSDVESREPSRRTPVVQSTKSRQVHVTQATPSAASYNPSSSSSLSEVESDSEYHASSPERHEASLSPSAISTPRPKSSKRFSPKKASPVKIAPQNPSPSKSVPATKSKKRKSGDDGTFRPDRIPDSESDISSLKPKRAPARHDATHPPPRKLQKITTPAKASIAQSRLSNTQAKVAKAKSKTPVKHEGNGERQSVSPAPSGHFTGLPYAKPSSQESKMAVYGTLPGEDVPPMPTLPKSVRLPSGEVVAIPPQSVITDLKAGRQEKEGSLIGGKRGGGQVGNQKSVGGSRLSKARPSVSPRKESSRREMGEGEGGEGEFEWPEDVF